MKHCLRMRRQQYDDAKMLVASVNKIKADLPETRSCVFGNLNRKRGALIREINRVSWLLWPDTGRPRCNHVR